MEGTSREDRDTAASRPLPEVLRDDLDELTRALREERANPPAVEEVVIDLRDSTDDPARADEPDTDGSGDAGDGDSKPPPDSWYDNWRPPTREELMASAHDMHRPALMLTLAIIAIVLLIAAAVLLF